MFLKPDQNLSDFFEAVQTCNQDVSYVSEEGDFLDLKSQFSQFIFLVMCVEKEFPRNGSIICKDSKDMERLAPFLE